MPEAIKIQGLNEFVRNLKRLDSDLPKVLRVSLNSVASPIVDETKSRMPRRSGRAAGSVVARSTQKQARIKEGGRRAPYVPFLDFGGRVGRKKSVKRPFLADGRYLYESYYDMRRSGRIDELLTKTLLDAAARAGVEVD